MHYSSWNYSSLPIADSLHDYIEKPPQCKVQDNPNEQKGHRKTNIRKSKTDSVAEENIQHINKGKVTENFFKWYRHGIGSTVYSMIGILQRFLQCNKQKIKNDGLYKLTASQHPRTASLCLPIMVHIANKQLEFVCTNSSMATVADTTVSQIIMQGTARMKRL